MAPTFVNTIGLVGVALTLIAYFLLQIEKLKADGLYFPLINAIGSLGIMYSLYYEWNLAAGVMELCWLIISLAGVIKYYGKPESTG
jgi:hypothetical protein